MLSLYHLNDFIKDHAYNKNILDQWKYFSVEHI